MRKILATAVFLTVGVAAYAMTMSPPVEPEPEPILVETTTGNSAKIASFRSYVNLTAESDAVFDRSLREISRGWHKGGAVMLVEAARFTRGNDRYNKVIRLLQAKTGEHHGTDSAAWYTWLWKQDYKPHPQYASFKSAIYSPIDDRFKEYFVKTDNAKIRLDEIRWGGVVRDGIPPLKNPKMVPVKQARYLADTDVVFGVDLNGDARCYPKRILAWHEMFKDTIGGESVCGAY